MKKTLYIALAAICFACTTKPIDEGKLFLTDQEADLVIQKGTLLTLNEFVDTYMTEEGNYQNTLYRERSKCVVADETFYLFTIDTIARQPDSMGVYIRGRITTDDYAGNFYKSLCIQQIVDGEQQALRISVDAGSVGGLYQIGQEILIRVDGLAIGRYANQPQLCVPSYNNNYYAQKAEEKVGWAPGRIPIAIFKAHTWCVGTPNVSKLVYTEMNIADIRNITNLKETRKLDGQLIRLKDVYFTGQYYDDNNNKYVDCTTMDPQYWPDGYDSNTANVFAPTTKGLGFPQSRVITNGTDSINVSTSEYAKFAHYYLPGADKNGIANCKDYKGTVVGIVGYYFDNGKKATDNPKKYGPKPSDWSVTIRSLDDLDLRDNDGNLWPRIEYSK